LALSLPALGEWYMLTQFNEVLTLVLSLPALGEWYMLTQLNELLTLVLSLPALGEWYMLTQSRSRNSVFSSRPGGSGHKLINFQFFHHNETGAGITDIWFSSRTSYDF
jgi:hypothetical protein